MVDVQDVACPGNMSLTGGLLGYQNFRRPTWKAISILKQPYILLRGAGHHLVQPVLTLENPSQNTLVKVLKNELRFKARLKCDHLQCFGRFSKETALKYVNYATCKRSRREGGALSSS
jgi:hypothetical protein